LFSYFGDPKDQAFLQERLHLPCQFSVRRVPIAFNIAFNMVGANVSWPNVNRLLNERQG